MWSRTRHMVGWGTLLKALLKSMYKLYDCGILWPLAIRWKMWSAVLRFWRPPNWEG